MTAAARLDPSTGLLRGVRAAVLTVPTVGAAAIGHALVDGCDSAFALLVATGLCWPAAVALLGRRRRLPFLVAWLLGAQVALHGVLGALCGDGGGLGHAFAGDLSGMLLAHAAAAAATGLVLCRADAGLWAAHALLRSAARLLGWARPVVLVPPRARRTSFTAVLLPRSSWTAAQPSRRGPPVLVALAS